MGRRPLGVDRGGAAPYNLISALHKSLRGGDADAARGRLARLLEAGEDPRDVARRFVRSASEDVGKADPAALSPCVAVAQGRGAGYDNAHRFAAGLVAQEHLPAARRDRIYYEPGDAGLEREWAARLRSRHEQRAALRQSGLHGIPRRRPRGDPSAPP